ncbi:MAG: hypothetical protein ACLP1D_25565 [Xanthobacteraceae bacterium]
MSTTLASKLRYFTDCDTAARGRRGAVSPRVAMDSRTARRSPHGVGVRGVAIARTVTTLMRNAPHRAIGPGTVTTTSASAASMPRVA